MTMLNVRTAGQYDMGREGSPSNAQEVGPLGCQSSMFTAVYGQEQP